MAGKKWDKVKALSDLGKALDRAELGQIKCQYCLEDAVLVTGKEVYPHRPDLVEKKFWKCPGQCDAYVGCHLPNKALGYRGTEPMGVLANPELRRAKMAAHAALDPFWKAAGIKRHVAYRWLAEQLGIHEEACHIGMFTVDQCKQVVAAVERMVKAVPVVLTNSSPGELSGNNVEEE